MLNAFEKKIEAFIEKEGLFKSGTKVLLAVSGGADSIALLEVMHALREDGKLRRDLLCAHINHQLRGLDADADEDFVIEQTKKLNLPVITKRIDVRACARQNKLSIETAARQLRIKNLMEIAGANNANWIVTAHHKNDNAETLLHHLVRGTGFRGLCGIWPIRTFGDIDFARPLLSVTREEIIEYLEYKKLNWRTDHTNKDISYRRNFIRHRLLPAIQQNCKDSVVEQLVKLADSSRNFYQQLCIATEKVQPQMIQYGDEKLTVDLNLFSEQHPAVRVELVRRSLVELGSGEGDLTEEHFERILQLTEENVSGRKIELPGGFVASREYNKLLFERKQNEKNIAKTKEQKTVEIPGRTRLGNFFIEAAVLDARMFAIEKFKKEKTSFAECFDADKVKPPVMIRSRKAGDRFIPLGLKNEKKVGKFLTDQQVPQRIRKRVLVITDSEKIIWLWPIRISEQAKISEKTRKILQLQITE